MTTIAPLTRTGTVVRKARIGTIGAVLWTLSSTVWAASEIEAQPFGSLAFVAVAVAWWICMVVAPLLVVVGHYALLAALGPAAGRVGRTGVGASAVGLAAMGLGIGIEVASMSAGGGEVSVGHTILLIGFLVVLLGSLVTGVTVIRRLAGTATRIAGWLLVLALPLGLAIGFLGSLIAPENDAVFWAVLTVPIGVAWVLLGRSVAAEARNTAVPAR
jgi:hypothetical protein